MHQKGMSRYLLWGLVLLLVGFGTVNCSDPEESPDGTFKISVAASPSEGEINGDEINLAITVLQSDNTPLPSGERVDIIEFGCVDTSQPAVGRFEGQPEDAQCGQTTRTVTTNNGTLSVGFQCVREGRSTILAAPSGTQSSSGSVVVGCVPGPNGQWSVSAISVTETGSLVVGQRPVTVEVKAVIEDGETGVPAGTRLSASIESGDSLTLSGPSLVGTNDQGVAQFSFLTNNNPGDTVVQVAFQDERFGMGGSESFRVREQSSQTDTILEVTVRRNNNVVNGEERTVLADGEDNLTLEARLLPPPGASFSVAGQPITFELTSGPGFFDDPGITEVSPNTDDNGEALVSFVGGDISGTSIIKISAINPNPESENPDEPLTTDRDVTINVTALGFIEYIGVEPSVLFVRGSGLNETGTVTFRVLDTNREPLVGVPVEMALPDLALGGVSLNPSLTTSDDEGKVSTTVQSGTGSGAVNVTATASLGAVELSAPSASIPIVGARPTRNAFNLQCDFRNVGGLLGRQGNRIVVSNQYACTSLLRDRFNNPVGVSQQINYLSEGGNIISPQSSVEWDTVSSPSNPPSNVGRVSAPYSPGGEPPCDVDPDEDAGEPFMFFDAEECPPTLNNCPERLIDDCSFNPRDALVTIVAITTGEEAFNDINANGEYDDGEPFWDIGEPFVDTNDNNVFDEGEPFRDLGSEEFEPNGDYDGPNGVWDANTTIWTSTNIQLSGEPATLQTSNEFDADPFRLSGYFFTLDDPTTLYPPGSTIEAEGVTDIGFVWQDANLSVLNPSTNYGVALVSGAQIARLVALSASSPTIQGGGYGFEVEFTTEELDNVRDSYITRIRDYVSGFAYVARIEPNNNATGLLTLRYTASLNISPGVGDTTTFNRDINVNIVAQQDE